MFDPLHHDVALRGYFPRLKTLTSLVMSPKVNLMDPFQQLIIVLTVARNECPRIK